MNIPRFYFSNVILKYVHAREGIIVSQYKFRLNQMVIVVVVVVVVVVIVVVVVVVIVVVVRRLIDQVWV